MDEQTWNIQRFEAEGRANFNRWSVSMMYGNYAAQPELGYLTRREGILTTGSIKVATNWVVTGSARWDLEANEDQPICARRRLCRRLLRAGGELCNFV